IGRASCRERVKNWDVAMTFKEKDITKNYNQLWIQCDNCYGLMYKKVEMNVCEECGHYLKMTSSERLELSIDPGTWNPMDEDMVSADPIKFHAKVVFFFKQKTAYEIFT